MRNANSFYNALVVEAERRPAQTGPLAGISFHAAYTFSKSVDDASTIVSSEGTSTSQKPQDSLDIKSNRGLSAFDIRNRFVANYTWDLPKAPFASGGFADKLFNGWQVNGITTVTQGIPFNIETGFGRSQNGSYGPVDRPDLIPGGNQNPVLGAPNQAPRYFDVTQFVMPPAGYYGNLGRNTGIGPGLVNQDFSLAKNIALPSISEAFAVQFKAEFFNLFNRANFAPLAAGNRRLFNSSGARLGGAGLIRSTATASRQIQFGLKILF